MRRKSAGKKIMAVLIAASLMLTPAELTVAAEMETEGAEATFLAEESGDAASSDQEDTAETEAEIADGSAATEEQETTDTDKPDTGNNVQENAETGVMEPGEEAPEGTAEEEDPETPEAAMDAAEALEECEQEEENAAFDDGTKDAVQASAEYSDGKFTWVLDGNGTLTITGNNMELTKNEISESALEKAGIDFSRVNKLVIGNGITGFDRWGMWNLKKYIKELEIHGNAGMNMPEQCFYDVPNIESVVISGAVDVPRDMFGKCTGLKKVTLKNGVRSIGEDAFRDCSSLESVIFENTVLEKISDGAFWGCSALSSIALPDSVTEIERNAFFETGLRNIQLPEKLTLIGGGAFCNCKNLKQVQLPPQLKELGDGAFFNCENLTQIQLPAQLNKLGTDAFRNCTSLDKIDIPAGLKQIESATFRNTGLTSVTLHEGLTKIEDWAFHDCLKLKKIRIPKSVTYIGELALGIRYNMGNGAEEVIPGGFTVEGYTGSAVENYLVFTKRPYELVGVVKKLRLQGIAIDLCKEERIKRADLLKKKETFACNSDIQKIVDYYSEKPTDFEGLCSELFESLGYIAKLTPPTNDGGYDILLTRGGEKTIVECKCYSIGHKVGRPNIQKLVGANNVVLADKMIFITTSDFSGAAISYAEEVEVKLINGNKLMELLHKQGFIEKEKVKINVMECQLETADLYPYVPRDIYESFFE